MAPTQADSGQPGDGRRTGRDLAILTFLTLLALGPFLTKAYHIDDTLFLDAAWQIRHHPLDFFGFLVNWYGFDQPMFMVTRNPPGVPYFIAGVASIGGWSEPVLHAAFLLPAIAAVLGTYFLARSFCRLPLLAAIMTLAAPAFLISSTNVMCDTTMLAFWVWAAVFWIEGHRRGSLWRLIVAACLIAAAGFSKYFGLCLIPLFLVYALGQGRAAAWRSITLLIPILVFVGYHVWTVRLYGRGLLTDAGTFVVQFHTSERPRSYVRQALTMLCFTGGCMLPVLLYGFRVWSRRALLIGGAVAAVATAAVVLARPIDVRGLYQADRLNMFFLAQAVVYGAGGLSIMALSIAHVWQRRDALSLLLDLWIWGTFLFAGFLNWEINGRTVLIMAPAVSILFVARLSGSPGAQGRALDASSLVYWLWPMIPALILSLAATWADSTLADSARLATQSVGRLHAALPSGSRIWFEGHWGFQYYMEHAGFRPLAYDRSVLMPGDRVVIPENGVNRSALPSDRVKGPQSTSLPVATWISTMNGQTGAGFYSDEKGPLPFVLGPAPLETYFLYEVVRPIDFSVARP